MCFRPNRVRARAHVHQSGRMEMIPPRVATGARHTVDIFLGFYLISSNAAYIMDIGAIQ